MTSRARLLIDALATLTFAAACSSDPPSAGGADTCTPGATQACLGPGRCEGAQICAPDGARWGDCACTGAPLARDAGEDAAVGPPRADAAPRTLLDTLDPDGPLAVAVSGWTDVPEAPGGTVRVVASGEFGLVTTGYDAPRCEPSRLSLQFVSDAASPEAITFGALVLLSPLPLAVGTFSDEEAPESSALFVAAMPGPQDLHAGARWADVPMFSLEIRTYDVAAQRVAVQMHVVATSRNNPGPVGAADLTIAVAGICP